MNLLLSSLTLFTFTTLMGKEIKTEILIHATPEKVWNILTKTDAYPQWNPFILSLKGELKGGNKIVAIIKPANSNAMTFHPNILTVRKNMELRWLGHLFIPGLFDGEHVFEIVDNGDGTVNFIQRETFKGLLVSIMSKKMWDNTKKGFESMNQRLKELCEGK